MLFRRFSLRVTLFLFILLIANGAAPLWAQTTKATTKTDKATTENPAPAPVVAQPNIVLPVINLEGLLPPREATAEPDVPPEPSFGTHLLDWLAQNSATVNKTLNTDFIGQLNLPQLSKWWTQQLDQPKLNERWTDLGQWGARVLLWSIVAALLFHILLTPLRRSLNPTVAYAFSRRLVSGLVQFCIGLIPIMALVFASVYVLAGVDLPVRVRMVLQGGVYALVFGRLLILCGKLLLAPKRDYLRLVPLGQERARHLYRWTQGLTIIAVIGYWLVDAARLMEVPEEPRRFFSHLLGLVLVCGLIFLIRSNRVPMAHWLRGNTQDNANDLLSWARYNLSAYWHRLMIAYLLIGYTVTILSPLGTGFGALLQGTVFTALIVFVMNIVLYGLNQLAHRAAVAQAQNERLPLHQPILRGLLRLLTTVSGIYLILLGWNVDFSAWMKTELAQRLMGASFSISIAVIVAVLCYEILCSLLNSAHQHQNSQSFPSINGVDRAARIKTLLPLIRHSAAVILTVAVMLIGLSELGINIAPLLAGAGIVGVAVGFGSQALVKDFITGLFIIIEDTIHVGDVVTCGTHSGTVESMTIRTLRLRDVNGALHVLSYSEVTGFINQTRGFAYAVMEIGVAYDTDMRRAFAVLADIGTQLQQDAELGQNILAPAEVNGILNFADSAIIIRVRIKTLPGQQWLVRYAYMLAMKERFDAEKIIIPFPTVTHQFGAASPDQARLMVSAPPRSTV